MLGITFTEGGCQTDYTFENHDYDYLEELVDEDGDEEDASDLGSKILKKEVKIYYTILRMFIYTAVFIVQR